MHVIVVIGVGAWRQYGGEGVTGCALHVVEEALLVRGAVPAVLHGDLAAVGEREGGDVERVAEGVLGDPRIGIAVHAAARIGGNLLDLDHGLTAPAGRPRRALAPR